MKITDILFPVKCPVCGEILPGAKAGMCASCYRELPVVQEPCCKRCGKSISSVEVAYCEDCQKKPDDMQGTTLWVYTPKVKKMMAGFKYDGCRMYADFFADEIQLHKSEKILSWAPDCVIPVPLHRRRKWFRGFNQAAELAFRIGERFAIPVLQNALARKRYTRPQNELDDKQRRQNLKGIMEIKDAYQEKVRQVESVLLVDDIYTTGATLEACAAVLHQAGVQKIYFLCLCAGESGL